MLKKAVTVASTLENVIRIEPWMGVNGNELPPSADSSLNCLRRRGESTISGVIPEYWLKKLIIRQTKFALLFDALQTTEQ